MSLEKLIQKLKQVKCASKQEKENVSINITICEMQIKIRDKSYEKIRRLQ